MKEVKDLTNEELESIYASIPLYMDWFKAVTEKVYDLAATGQSKRYKLVYGRSVRQWASVPKALEFFDKHDISEEDRYIKKMITPPQAEKLIPGHGDIRKLLADIRQTDYVVKPQGKLVLAPIEDKRAGVLSSNDAGEYFEGEGESEDI